MITHYLVLEVRYNLRHPIRFLLDLFREIRAVIIRGLYGWHKSDLWSMDLYLLDILPEMLDCFAKNLNSYPSNITFKLHKKEIESISKSFKNVSILREKMNSSEKADKLFKDTWDRLGSIFFNLWD